MTDAAPDLYTVLGLDRAAQPSRKAIHAAYRKLAKKLHPDVGGDPAAFEAIRVAHDVLTDAARRAHYDATGEFTRGGEPDNAHIALYTQLGLVLDNTMQRVLQEAGERDVCTIDIVAEMRKDVRSHKKTWADREKALQAAMPLFERMADRFKRKGDGPNVLGAIFAARLASNQTQQQHCRDQMKHADDLLEALEGYWFDRIMTLGAPLSLAATLRFHTPTNFNFRGT